MMVLSVLIYRLLGKWGSGRQILLFLYILPLGQSVFNMPIEVHGTFFCFLPQMLYWNHKQVSWEVSWVNVSVLFQQDPLDYRSSVIRAPESLPWNRQFWEGTRIFRCTAWLEVLKSAREKSIIDLFSPSPVSDFSFPLSYSPTTHYCQYPSPVSHSAFEVP